jgi:hypothetical protein
VRHLITNMLEPSPLRRVTVFQALGHIWIARDPAVQEAVDRLYQASII